MKKELLLLYIILCFFSSFGQDAYHTFDQFTIDDGLSQSEIKCIKQDNKGYLWFGTLYGLNRYNGLSFEVFVTNPSDSNSISNNIIYTLWLDHQNKLWIGTQDGLNIYDPRLDKISIIKKNSQNANSLGDNKITTIIQDDELNYRIISNGHKILYDPRIQSKYYVRGSINKLYKQYFQYGYWNDFIIYSRCFCSSICFCIIYLYTPDHHRIL